MCPLTLRPRVGRPGRLVVAALTLAACGSRGDGDSRAVSRDSASSDAPSTTLPRPAPPPAPPPAAMPDTPVAGAPSPDRGPVGEAASPPPAAADTLRGTVAVVGSSPTTRVVLLTPDGVEHRIDGPAAATLRRVADLEVVLRGARAPRAFRAESFVVRAAAGREAQDGVLARDGDRWTLRRVDGGPLLIGELPDALREHVGRRVWLVVADGGEVVSFGRIE